jgi:hypothetical protein
MSFFKDRATEVGAVIWYGAIAIAIIAVGFLVWSQLAPRQEAVRRDVYDQSRAYQQGTQLNISRWCAEMRTKPEHSKAIAAMIRDAAATYDGPLSGDNQSCILEAQGQ